ncbi:MAG: class I SAM-dependent methyltransferase, partial [Deltaproteobacteria bacterium]|nr:class I SAM-dependent methyltransferase [Deltaproteobacteria bacterium]
PEVLDGLGDVTGKSVLHLQCHFGQDSIRIKLAGAREVVGIDFSDVAIAKARALAAEMAVDVRFIQTDLYELTEVLDQQFDVVFTSYGVIGWLPDLEPWGKIVARHLKPGGRFFFIEGHPTMWLFDGSANDLIIKYPYFRQPEPIELEPSVGTYSDPTATFTGTEYSWPHELGETITSLTSAGLHLEEMREYAHTVWQAFPFMVEEAPGRFVMPPDKPKLPLMFSLRVTKPA